MPAICNSFSNFLPAFRQQMSVQIDSSESVGVLAFVPRRDVSWERPCLRCSFSSNFPVKQGSKAAFRSRFSDHVAREAQCAVVSQHSIESQSCITAYPRRLQASASTFHSFHLVLVNGEATFRNSANCTGVETRKTNRYAHLLLVTLLQLPVSFQPLR